MSDRRFRIGATGVGTGLVVSILSILGGPLFGATAWATPTSSCRTVLLGEVVGSVDNATRPVVGSTVSPGSEIAVQVTWATANWDGTELDRVIVCVSIDREREDHFMKVERPGPNDGSLDHAFTLPADIPIGSEVCVRSEISGSYLGQPLDHRSGTTCFTVAAAPSTTAPTTVTPITQPVVQDSPITQAPPVPRGQETPVAVADPAPLALVELPRTGSALMLLPVGLGLALGGAGVLVSARRRRP